MTDNEVLEIMLDGALEHLGVTLGAAYASLGAAGLVVVPKERLLDLRTNLMGAHHDMDDIAQETIERVMGQLVDLAETGDCEVTLNVAALAT